MTLTIFLSCVTNEFGSLRPTLARMVQRTQLPVRYQEDFAHHGVPTVHMLEEQIRTSDVVLHILGCQSGAKAPAEQVEAFLGRHPKFAERFADIAADGRNGQISYTQWEAWLALFFGKRLYVYQVPADSAALQPAQQTHAQRLRQREVYPRTAPDKPALLEEIRVSLPTST
jgi:hypothetical protein